MKRSSLFLLSTVISLAAILCSGCSGNENETNNGSITYGTQQELAGTPGMLGNGRNGIRPDGSGTSDGQPSLPQYHHQSTRGITHGMSIAGRSSTNWREAQQRESNTPSQSSQQVNNIEELLMVGDILIVHVMDEKLPLNIPTHYQGQNIRIMQVSGPENLQILRRVRASLQSSQLHEASGTIGSDISYLIKEASLKGN